MNVLLDTCALVWLVNRDQTLSDPAGDAIRSAHFSYVSSVTAWELGLKLAKDKLSFGEPLETWYTRALEQHQLSEFSLDARTAMRATRLPPIHADPADRFLIAAAMEHQMTLLTPDATIHRYPGVKTLW